MTRSDDAPTWRKRREPRIQTDDERAMASAAQRRHPSNAAIVLPSDEFVDVTSPHDLLEREPDEQVAAVVERSRRNSEDPATYADVVKLAVALTKERSANQKRNADTEVVLQGPHKAHRATRRNLIATVVFAAVSAGSAVKQWSEHPSPSHPDGGDAIRIEQLRDDVRRLDSELREIRAALNRRFEIPIRETHP